MAAGSKRRPSIAFRRGPNPLLIAIPAIVMVLAVYVGLVYVSRIVQKVAESPNGKVEPKVEYLRDVDGVVKLKPALQQDAPPAPEEVVAEYYREQRAAAEAARNRIPILEPVLEQEEESAPNVLPIQPLSKPELPPLPNPRSNGQG